MTTTPHPADALPLPVPFAVFDEFGKGADDRVQDMLRAAHREGFELAMSKSADLVDILHRSFVSYGNAMHSGDVDRAEMMAGRHAEALKALAAPSPDHSEQHLNMVALAAPAQEQSDTREIVERIAQGQPGLAKAYAEAIESLRIVVAERDALKQQQAGAAEVSIDTFVECIKPSLHIYLGLLGQSRAQAEETISEIVRDAMATAGGVA